MDAHIIWPPPFTLKKHPRARYVKLKASPQKGLELIVPLRFNAKEIPSILETNRSWIEKQMIFLHSQQSKNNVDTLPQSVHFATLNQTWKIEYLSMGSKLRVMTRPHLQEIVLVGDISNKILCNKGLIAWSKQQAKILLPKLLSQVSQEVQLPYTSVTIRDQSSLWGSCSAKKSINLNYKLLFLSPALTRYVMIHELCHTVHFNHSIQFWKVVEAFDPDWKQHRKELHQASKMLPAWLACN